MKQAYCRTCRQHWRAVCWEGSATADPPHAKRTRRRSKSKPRGDDSKKKIEGKKDPMRPFPAPTGSASSTPITSPGVPWVNTTPTRRLQAPDLGLPAPPPPKPDQGTCALGTDEKEDGKEMEMSEQQRFFQALRESMGSAMPEEAVRLLSKQLDIKEKAQVTPALIYKINNMKKAVEKARDGLKSVDHKWQEFTTLVAKRIKEQKMSYVVERKEALETLKDKQQKLREAQAELKVRATLEPVEEEDLMDETELAEQLQMQMLEDMQVEIPEDEEPPQIDPKSPALVPCSKIIPVQEETLGGRFQREEFQRSQNSDALTFLARTMPMHQVMRVIWIAGHFQVTKSNGSLAVLESDGGNESSMQRRFPFEACFHLHFWQVQALPWILSWQFCSFPQIVHRVLNDISSLQTLPELKPFVRIDTRVFQHFVETSLSLTFQSCFRRRDMPFSFRLPMAPYLKAAYGDQHSSLERLWDFSFPEIGCTCTRENDIWAQLDMTLVDFLVHWSLSFGMLVYEQTFQVGTLCFVGLAILAITCFYVGLEVTPPFKGTFGLRCPLRIRRCRMNRKTKQPASNRAVFRSTLTLWLLLSSHVTPVAAQMRTNLVDQTDLEKDFPHKSSSTSVEPFSDEAALVSLRTVVATQLGSSLASQAIYEPPSIFAQLEEDPVTQETARLDEALLRTWQLYNAPQDAYTCLIRTRRLPAMPPNVCRRVVESVHLPLASAALRRWEDLTTREWGLIPVTFEHPTFLGHFDIAIILAEPAVENVHADSPTAAVEIVAATSPGTLVSVLFARFVPRQFSHADLIHLWDIVPCRIIECEFWVGAFPLYAGQTFDAFGGMHLQIYIPSFAFTSQLVEAGVSGPRWLQFWCDQNQPIMDPSDTIELKLSQSLIRATGQLTVFRVPKPFEHNSQIQFDVRPTTLDLMLEELITDQWMDLHEDHWQWTHVDDSWQASPFLEQFVHVMLAYDTRIPQKTILSSVENDRL